MEPLQNFCRHLHRRARPHRRTDQPRTWSENETMDNKPMPAFVVILRTRGCFWANRSGCSMCGYFRDSSPSISEKDIRRQLAKVLNSYDGQPIVKIFTSGSFFDTQEIPTMVQQEILDTFYTQARQVTVETRPEFLRCMNDLDIPSGKQLEIAMGLESANDRVLKYAIAKGFTYAQWRSGAEQVIDAGHRLKVYILIKPPFLKESEAITDALESARQVDDIAHTISFNPVAIHGYTLVDYLWHRGLYRPPWLWSVVQVLVHSAKEINSAIKCDVVAGGKQRGAHNCGICDAVLLDAIRQFSLDKNHHIFNNLNCGCREEWLDMLELDGFLQG
jgi:radical SAM enzyme (TIGR01210 family)